MTRETLAEVLEKIAQLLELKGENPFKIRAYRTGAEVVMAHAGDIVGLAREGQLEGIKGIGEALRDKHCLGVQVYLKRVGVADVQESTFHATSICVSLPVEVSRLDVQTLQTWQGGVHSCALTPKH
jgi:DNA polymerase/3'-5' exonuclease PolX